MSEKPKKPDAWMPWYIGKYLADTAHLSRAEHGSYLLMLAHAWMHGGVLPTDDPQLARIARCTAAEWVRSKATLLAFWQITDGQYTQRRLGEELVKARLNLDQRIAAGRASAEKRWGQKNSKKDNGFSNETVTDVITPVIKNVTDVTIPLQRNDTPIPKTFALSAPLNETPAAPLESQKLAPPAALDGAPRKRLNGSHPKGEKRLAPSTASWAAYSQAYRERYHVDPVRNKQANSMLCKLVEMLGEEDAPQVAAFYVGHNKAWYVEHGHNLGSLVKDADWLRTQWVTGRTVTSGQARQADRTQGQANIWNEIISEERDKERAINER